MTSINELQQVPCDKIDARCVDAYIKLLLDEAEPTRLIIDHSWGESDVDLTPAIKAGETITHLFLTPDINPTALQYNREDFQREGAENDGIDCIEGDALSRIISMRYLKDVDQNKYPSDGDVYMYDDVTNLFYTFNLKGYVDKTDGRLDGLEGRVNDLEEDLKNAWTQINILDGRVKTIQNQVFELQNKLEDLTQQFNAYVTKTDSRLETIEATIAKPSWAPSSARLAWANVNYMWDQSPSSYGIYGHNPSSNVTGDGRFK